MNTSHLIGVSFALAILLILLIQIMLYDALRGFRRIYEEVSEVVDHDTKIFPDHI